MSRPVYLVACSDTKRAGPCPARDLYTGQLFIKARAYVEARGAPWFILSAQHGLVDPDELLRAYNRPLAGMDVPQRKAWGDRVVDQLGRTGLHDRPLIALAGRLYRDALQMPPERLSAPLAGLAIGQQLAWLKAALAEPVRP